MHINCKILYNQYLRKINRYFSPMPGVILRAENLKCPIMVVSYDIRKMKNIPEQ